MRVLFVVPKAKFNYKAPFVPLGMYSIATYLKEHGHTVKVTDRVFEKTPLQKVINEFSPGVIAVTCHSSRVASDAVDITKLARQNNIPVIWGAGFATEFYEQILNCGHADYITMGEGEINTLNLINAIETGSDVSLVKGIAMMKDGKPYLSEPQELAELKDLPVIDFSVYDPEKYMHRYMYCNKMMYIYSGKGCPARCTFCSNTRFNCYRYRVRPTEYVVSEIKYLYQNHGLDGVYFSDDCWYVNKKHMYDLCEKLEEEKIDIKWGCEVRVGVYNCDDLKYMYDHGCRWIFFGVESGNNEMLKRINKGISKEQVKETIENCKKAGITSISSFIIGYPDETPEQLQDTIYFAFEIDSGVTSFAIFTPSQGSDLCDELTQKGVYKKPKTWDEVCNNIVGEYSAYVCNTIPAKELQVIRAHFLWKSFTKKNTASQTRSFEVATNAVKDAFDNLTRLGIKELFPGLILIAKEFFPVFFYANFFPKIKKKYKLK